MKKLSLIVAYCLFMLLSFSCNKENEQTSNLVPVTLEASAISCRNATINGQATLPSVTSADLKLGVLYSTSSGVLYGSSTAIEAKSFDSSYNFSVITDVLEPETTYYYRTFIYQNGEVSYGETKSFTTEAVNTMIQTLDVSEVDASVATLNAFLNLENCQYSKLEYGFIYKPEGGDEIKVYVNSYDNNSFREKLYDLERVQKYEASAFVTLDGRTYLGDKKTFVTQSVKATIKLAPVTGVTEYRATLSGVVEIESEGVYSITSAVYYDNVHSTAEELRKEGLYQDAVVSNGGLFSTELTKLNSGTKYNYVVVAQVDGVEIISEVGSFTTDDFSASIPTLLAQTSEHSGTLSATIALESKEDIDVSLWFLYSATASDLQSLTTEGIKATASRVNDTQYSVSIDGLKVETEYYYVALAEVGGKSVQSDINTFSTKPVVFEASISNEAETTEKSISLQGIATSGMTEPLSNFTISNKLYYSSSESTAAAIVSSGESLDIAMDNDLSFSTSLDNLTSNTKYYFVVQSLIDEVQVLSDVYNFNTKKITASVSVSDAEAVKYTQATISGGYQVNTSTDLTITPFFLYSNKVSSVDELKAQGNRAEVSISGATFSATLNNLIDGETYYYVAATKVHDTEFFSSVRSFTTSKLPNGAVDLGLSVVWHKYNLGASSEEEYGDYYAWGETETKEVYTVRNYKWRDANAAYQLSKYNTSSQLGIVDNKTVLDNEDDVAIVKLGNGWHMPVLDNFKELIENCDYTWTTINGKKGYLFVSRINGNSIFLPAAGFKGEQGLDYQNNWGRYFTRELNESYPEEAKSILFSDFKVQEFNSSARFIGQTVRPVHE